MATKVEFKVGDRVVFIGSPEGIRTPYESDPLGGEDGLITSIDVGDYRAYPIRVNGMLFFTESELKLASKPKKVRSWKI